ELDKKRVQEFARKVFGFYTGGVLTLMIELGYRHGLFEAAAQGPATSSELAARAGLDERYVREWLGAMATGGVVDYDAATSRFTLPAEHAQCLTGASSRNLAPGSQTQDAGHATAEGLRLLPPGRRRAVLGVPARLHR